jgi:phosphoribosylformimino-5-aminoimidazole carboxamide ribonucleotide (ProFAR) isomerase
MDLMNTDKILFEEISAMIERAKRTIYTQANRESVLLFWNIGRRVNDDVLQNKRADYGKQIVVSLSRQLTEKYGRSFEEKNLRRMRQFAEQFMDEEIIVTNVSRMRTSRLA